MQATKTDVIIQYCIGGKRIIILSQPRKKPGFFKTFFFKLGMCNFIPLNLKYHFIKLTEKPFITTIIKWERLLWLIQQIKYLTN